MSLNHILNFIQISDNIATSGQPSPEQFASIANAGYTSLINLAMPDSTNALPDEGGFVTESGMNYFHIPVPFEAPNKDHLTLFLNLMEILKNEKVWVHCALNMRVSAFMQHYQRHLLKRSAAECVPMLHGWQPEPVWQSFLELRLDQTC